MFLANENFPKPSIILLRNKSINVKSIQEDYQGIDDERVIKIANELNLIILTFDRDYGELIFKHSIDLPPAIIYFRDKGNDPLFAGQLLARLLENPTFIFTQAFTVIEEKNVRQRFYKKQ